MEDKLRLNTKLYGFDGIIGRRDCFLNGIIIASISMFFGIPYTIWLFSHMHTMADLFNLHLMFVQAPILLKVWFLTGYIGTIVLSVSNMYRRINDIRGNVNNNINLAVSMIYLLPSLSIIFPLPLIIYNIFFFASLILWLVLLFKRGKITQNYPYDFTKEFNWGAFIGTWIWGLFNKSYKTLWMLLIGFTPWAMYYAIYCGLKGNEWAFKNKKCNDVEVFNKSQEKQTTIFAIIFFVGIPVIYFLTVFAIVFTLMFATIGDIKNNPQKAEQTMTQLENSMSKFGSLYFESHLITSDENKYYVLSSDWNTFSFSDKKNIIDMAASLASMERRKEYEKQHPKSFKSFSKTEELNRTKIYSVETKHLLGEYHFDEASLKTGSVKDVFKATLKAYKFYN